MSNFEYFKAQVSRFVVAMGWANTPEWERWHSKEHARLGEFTSLSVKYHQTVAPSISAALACLEKSDKATVQMHHAIQNANARTKLLESAILSLVKKTSPREAAKLRKALADLDRNHEQF